MLITPLFILTSGQIAVQINDDNGNLLTKDMGLGVPYGSFYVTELSKLRKWAAENQGEIKFPNSAKNYDYLPKIEDSHLENLIYHLKEKRVSLSEDFDSKNTKRKVTKVPINTIRSFVSKGDFEYCAGSFGKAIEYFEKVIAIDPNNTHAWAFTGHCYWRSGKRALAQRCYEKVREINPGYTDIVFQNLKNRMSN